MNVVLIVTYGERVVLRKSGPYDWEKDEQNQNESYCAENDVGLGGPAERKQQGQKEQKGNCESASVLEPEIS